MPYCPKCGNKVEDTTNFCPNCGTQLKGATPIQASSTEPYQSQEKAAMDQKQEKQEKGEHPDKGKKQEKAEYGFVTFLVSGLVLITIGVFAVLELTNPALTSGAYLAIMLLVIGLIVIISAIYVATAGRKRFPPTVR